MARSWLAMVLSDFALDREHIGQFAIECFRPHVGVIARVDELRVYSHPIRGPLHAALQNV